MGLVTKGSYNVWRLRDLHRSVRSWRQSLQGCLTRGIGLYGLFAGVFYCMGRTGALLLGVWVRVLASFIQSRILLVGRSLPFVP